MKGFIPSYAIDFENLQNIFQYKAGAKVSSAFF